MTRINKEEYEILKNLDEKWKWIAKDDNYGGFIFCFREKPHKDIRKGGWSPDTTQYKCLWEYDVLFQFIQWEDEEPHNIAELIEEYEHKEFYDYVGWKYAESEETEVNKDIEWLKREIHNELEDWHGVEGGIDGDGINEIMLLINQHEESEVKRLERKIKELDSYNDELIRDNNQFRNELDNQEVLSHEWIERNTSPVDDEGRLYVWKSDLQNAIVPKPELPVAPKWFDKWWKDVAKGAGSLFHNIDRFYDELFSSGTREMYDYISSPDNKQKLLNIIVNELDYVVEEEQRYYLKIGNLYLAEPLGDMTSDIVRMTRDKGVAYQFTDKKSIATHLDKFEGTEAVKAEELEE